MTKIKLLILSYIAVIIALFLYTFTQVDLSLTFSQSSIFQTVQKFMQHIGFFQRPLSATIFGIIATLLFIYYLLFLFLSKKGIIKSFHLKLLIPLVVIILGLSYNAFSYDLFNYIFDAKIVTFYQQNPYFHAPIDFAGDPMLNFMRWTHRFYPYGPSWLVLTLPLSYMAFNIFLVNFFLFKGLIVLTFLGSCYLIYKISEIIFPKEKIFNTLFFALNPLVMFEGLVSVHNDFPLIFFALLGFYLFLKKKKFGSFLSLIFSIGIKYASVILVPIFIGVIIFERLKKNINYEYVFLISTIVSLLAIIFASYRTTFQPWYLMFPFSLAAFVSRKYYVFIPVIVSSIFCSIIYVSYVLLTDYSIGYPELISKIELYGLVAIVAITFLYFVKTRLIK